MKREVVLAGALHPAGLAPVRIRLAAAAIWPVGLGFALATTMGALSGPLLLILDAAFVGAALQLLRALQAARDRTAATLVLSGAGLFALVGLTGAPSAAHPNGMLLNAAVLLAVATALLVAAVRLALRLRSAAARVPAALAVVALVVGSAGYLANLLARWAVVLSGAAQQQAGFETTAWMASAYLTGLAAEPSPIVLLLVWLDLLQLGYLVLTYLAFAALAVALGRDGAIPAGVARSIGVTGYGLAALVGLAAAVADAAPDGVGTVAAAVAFVLTIPFCTTLLPHVLGLALLGAAATADPTRRTS